MTGLNKNAEDLNSSEANRQQTKIMSDGFESIQNFLEAHDESSGVAIIIR